MRAFRSFLWLGFVLAVQVPRLIESSPVEREAEDSNEVDVTRFLNFPEDFVVGAATASYQIEGAWNVSGKGVSVWDHFVHDKNSTVRNHETGDVACDSFYKYKEDVAILKKLGLKAYRFSVSWPRIMPNGFPNKINKDGLAYYHRLLDELLANGIEPIVTMLHWDHPKTLEDLGGWINEEMVDWFADYARVLFRELGPKVKKWITLNEPAMMCLNGYSLGIDAPGKNVHGIAEYLCVHNAIKAHARVYRMYQQEFKTRQKGVVGVSVHLQYYYPKNVDTDRSAADRANHFLTDWIIHPIFSGKGDYHDVLKDIVANNSKVQGYSRSRLPEFSEEWINYIRGSADFMGINYYTSFLMEYGNTGADPSFSRDSGVIRSADPSWGKAGSSWLNVVPKGFGDLLRKVASEYDNPTIYITENGVSDCGGTNDSLRIEYFHGHLKEMLIAMNRDGVNVKGYMVWSLLDNFEWREGYSEKFGIVKVDFNDPSRKRTFKDSALWWKRLLYSRSLEPIPVKKPDRT